jgi:hypothetical protein
MVPEVHALSDGSISIDWTKDKRAGWPVGPYITLTPAQWAGLVQALKQLKV